MRKNNVEDKVMEVFFNFPQNSFHIRELARKLDISPPAVSNAVRKMERKGFFIVEKGQQHKVSVNTQNKLFRNLKRAFNLKKIYESGLFDLIASHYPLNTVVLFGSYSRGDDMERSDIDIAILDAKEKKLEFGLYEKILCRRIHLEFVPWNKASKELKNSIMNGIVLNGGLEI